MGNDIITAQSKPICKVKAQQSWATFHHCLTAQSPISRAGQRAKVGKNRICNIITPPIFNEKTEHILHKLVPEFVDINLFNCSRKPENHFLSKQISLKKLK